MSNCLIYRTVQVRTSNKVSPPPIDTSIFYNQFLITFFSYNTLYNYNKNCTLVSLYNTKKMYVSKASFYYLLMD